MKILERLSICETHPRNPLHFERCEGGGGGVGEGNGLAPLQAQKLCGTEVLSRTHFEAKEW